jgi:hypothetical protein
MSTQEIRNYILQDMLEGPYSSRYAEFDPEEMMDPTTGKPSDAFWHQHSGKYMGLNNPKLANKLSTAENITQSINAVAGIGQGIEHVIQLGARWVSSIKDYINKKKISKTFSVLTAYAAHVVNAYATNNEAEMDRVIREARANINLKVQAFRYILMLEIIIQMSLVGKSQEETNALLQKSLGEAYYSAGFASKFLPHMDDIAYLNQSIDSERQVWFRNVNKYVAAMRG